MIDRLNNWPRLLAEHVDANRDRPFAWGQHDCLLWAASCVYAITGYDPAADLRGTYSTALEGMRIMDEAGGIRKLIERQLPGGADCRTHRNLACRGDVMTMDDARGYEAAGIRLDDTVAFVGASGLVFVSVRECNLRAWRVG